MSPGPFTIETKSQVHLTSAEDAAAQCGSPFYPHTVEQLGAGQDFSLACRVTRVGPLTVSDVTYNADVRLDFAELGTAYHVNAPLSGSVQSRHRNVDVVANAGLAAVYRPQGETVVTRWAAHSRNLAVKLDRAVVDRALAEVLRGTDASAVAFAPSIDLRAGEGRSWTSLLRMLVGQVGDRGSVLHQPMTAMPFVETIVNGFLVIASPAYRQLLDRPAESIRPAAIRRAVDIIHAEAHKPLTIAVLARACQVSVRSLQEGFQQHVGVPPMTYLRSVRLARAHADLRAGDPARDTVAAIALRWGFSNPSRFARQHQRAYGELPAATLRARGRTG